MGQVQNLLFALRGVWRAVTVLCSLTRDDAHDQERPDRDGPPLVLRHDLSWSPARQTPHTGGPRLVNGYSTSSRRPLVST